MVKRLIGGLVLLNLCAISLDISAGEIDITNEGVLEQLKELRTFIDVKRDFSKESKQLKPVLVQYRSNASKIDGVVQCNMEFNTDALHLNICGTSIQKDGSSLTITINVVYEYTDYVGYTIKTAKLNVVHELNKIDLSNPIATISYTSGAFKIDELPDVNAGDIVYIRTDEQDNGTSFALGIVVSNSDSTIFINTSLGMYDAQESLEYSVREIYITKSSKAVIFNSEITATYTEITIYKK